MFSVLHNLVICALDLGGIYHGNTTFYAGFGYRYIPKLDKIDFDSDLGIYRRLEYIPFYDFIC